MQKQKNKQTGITLIALVVTVIILIILAGVSINMLVGENGIITQAQTTKEETKESTASEIVSIAVLGATKENGNIDVAQLKKEIESRGGTLSSDTLPTTITLDGYLFKVDRNGNIEQRKQGGTLATVTGEETSNTTVEDAIGNKVVVPAGFIVVNPEDYVTDGIVIQKVSNGNQYVWIPCTTDSSDTSKLQYQRTEWGVEADNDTVALKDELTLTEASVTYTTEDIENGINTTVSAEIVEQINSEKASIEQYGGYYIGRYETGNVSNTAVIQQNVEPYASVKWSVAYSLAKEIDVGSAATSYLCSSYAWDTAINFIQNNTTWSNYATSRENTNDNWLDKKVVDVNGAVIKEAGIPTRLKTGLTTAKANIYDMGGNVGEFTTELKPGVVESVVLRGGVYGNTINPTGDRWDSIPSDSSSGYGFRATLFLK